MKNKFMTKALAVVLSASMALSLSSATALTANAAAAPKLAKKTVSVKAGKKAKNKLKAASYKAGWRITKATVKKTAVAKAKVKKNKKVVVVTGVKKGATKIVLKLKNAKTGAAKKLKFKAKVKVDKPVIEEPVVADVAAVTAAKQITFDTVDLTFDRAVDNTIVSNETVAINGSVGAATTVVVSGNQATVSYGYAENTDYTFTVSNLNGSASIKTGSYAVSDIKIEDQTVEAGSDQPIVYSLVGENGVDVTKYNNYTDYVDFQVEGDYTEYSADAVKPTIRFDEKDKTATVTVKFDNGSGEAITKTVKITSIAATATKGSARFAKGALKKWYLPSVADATSDTFSIHPDDTDATLVYFFAKSDAGKAIQFSEMEVISSNENVANANYEQGASGKYFVISVTPGGDQGNATITLKTTETKGSVDVPSEYKFNVSSKEKNNNLYDVKVASSSVSLYNGAYGSATDVEMKPVNSLGETVEVVDSIEVKKGNDEVSDVTAVWNSANNKLHIDAFGAPAGSYKVIVTFTGESGSNSKDIVKQITVRVTDVISAVYEVKENATTKPDYVWDEIGGKICAVNSDVKVKTNLSANFKVEVENLNVTDTAGNKTSFEPKLAVYVNSKPIGYLAETGVKGFAEGKEIGQRAIKKALSKLTVAEEDVDLAAISVFVYSGANYYDDYVIEEVVDTKTGETTINKTLYLGQANKTEYVKKEASESTNTIPLGGKVSLYESGNQAAIEYYGAGNVKNSCAKEGNYTVVVKYMDETFKDKDGKFTGYKFDNGYQLGTSKFTVSYSLTMPKVEYNASASAEKPVIADVDLVRAEDGTSVTWVSGTTKRVNSEQYKYNSLARTTPGVSAKFKTNEFGNASLSKGEKIFAVCVEDYRGAWNDEEQAWAVCIHFMFEDTKTVKG